jgi:N-acetylneuraminic acid mutarotase
LYRNENKDCRDVERYDPFVNKWTSMPPMLYPRNRLAVGTIDHCIYAVGGSSGQQLYSSVEKYSTGPDAESWVEVSPMNTARIGLAVCTHSRLLYAIGGFDGHRRLADVESYNPDLNTWKREQPLRVGRSGAAAASLAQCIYVVGGYASDSVEGPMQLDVVERYDIVTQQWSYVKSMNCRRSALSCVTLNNCLFALGNISFNYFYLTNYLYLGGYDGINFSSVVEIYDPEKDIWTYGTSLTRERSGHGSALTVEPTLENDE